MGVGIIGLVNKLQETKYTCLEHRKPSAFPTQNNSLCTECGWEGDKLAVLKGSTMYCCPQCGGIYFKSVLKPEYAKLPPVDMKAPFEGERKHFTEDGWRIY